MDARIRWLLNLLGARIYGRCPIRFDISCPLGAMDWLWLWTLLDCHIRETSWARDVGYVASFWSHILAHLRELSDKTNMTLFKLWLNIALSIRLLLNSFLWTILGDFAATTRDVVLNIIIHTSMFPARLDSGFWALNANLVVDIVSEPRVISLREERRILIAIDYANAAVILHDFLFVLKGWWGSMGPLGMLSGSILLLLGMVWICLWRISGIYYLCRVVRETWCRILLIWAIWVLQVLLWAFPLLYFPFVVHIMRNIGRLGSCSLSWRW